MYVMWGHYIIYVNGLAKIFRLLINNCYYFSLLNWLVRGYVLNEMFSYKHSIVDSYSSGWSLKPSQTHPQRVYIVHSHIVSTVHVFGMWLYHFTETTSCTGIEAKSKNTSLLCFVAKWPCFTFVSISPNVHLLQ